MIISHYYKFIFIKPRKVAGTTIELILSPFLEPGDLATSLQPEEEKLRVTKKGVLVGDIYKMNYFGLPSKLRDHSTLKKTYSLFNQSLEGYKVVSACRNPWDRAVSNFFWAKRHTSIAQRSHDVQKKEFLKFTNAYGPKTWMDHFYGRKRQRRLNSWHLYSDKKVCKVSYFKNRITGFCILSSSDDALELYIIFVDPDFRNLGIAKSFLFQAKEYAKKKFFKKILLEVNENNIKAISLYKKQNFFFSGKRKNYYYIKKKFIDAFLMQLTI